MTPMSKLLTACVISLTIGGEFAANAATLPQLPQRQVDVTMPTVTGLTLNATCATLQAQLIAAAALNVNLTHRIILATGTTCTGPYKLPSHNGGTGWILITGPNMANLPPSGTRVGPNDTSLMPVIKYGDDGGFHVGMFHADTGAQRYRIIGISMIQDSTMSPNWSFIVMGYHEINALNTGYIIVDRCVLRDTDINHPTRQGIFMNAERGNTAIIDSYVSGIKDVGRGSDTQAVLSTANPGPILLQNSFLQASGENVMLGGGGTPSDAVQPRDITIRLNTFDKDPAWVSGGQTLIKTLFELKEGQRVLIEGNDFLNMPWDDGGAVFRLTVRGQGGETWNDVSDVTIRHNLFKNISNFINSFGSDDFYVAKHSKRWHIHNNLIYGLGWSCFPGSTCGSFYSIMDGATTNGCTDPTPTCKMEDLTIAHNTVDDVRDRLLCTTVNGHIGLDFRDNLINLNSGRGVFDCGGSTSVNFGSARLSEAWGATWTWTNNRITTFSISGESDAGYPQGTNTYPSSYQSFLWTNRATRDYTLLTGSPAKGAASDGTDQGVNFSAYNAARAGGGGGGADLTPPATPQNVNITIN